MSVTNIKKQAEQANAGDVNPIEIIFDPNTDKASIARSREFVERDEHGNMVAHDAPQMKVSDSETSDNYIILSPSKDHLEKMRDKWPKYKMKTGENKGKERIRLSWQFIKYEGKPAFLLTSGLDIKGAVFMREGDKTRPMFHISGRGRLKISKTEAKGGPDCVTHETMVGGRVAFVYFISANINVEYIKR